MLILESRACEVVSSAASVENEREKAVLATFYFEGEVLPLTPSEAPEEPDYDDSQVKSIPFQEIVNKKQNQTNIS